MQGKSLPLLLEIRLLKFLLSMELLKQIAEQELASGRGPTGMAAAVLYIASVLCGERRTQREVAEVAGVTEVTIRNRYKELAEKLDIEIIL
jgi:transcription initiation factor TFIIB